CVRAGPYYAMDYW
nr:immunoglobulin heavy chain junction region [Mus musculus]